MNDVFQLGEGFKSLMIEEIAVQFTKMLSNYLEKIDF